MADNLPLACSQAESLKIKARLDAAIKETRTTLGFIAPDLDRAQVDLELGQELVRAGYRILNGKPPGAFHCEGCGCEASEPEKLGTEQPDDSGEEWRIARGTVPGTSVVP